MKGIGSKARTDDGYKATCAASCVPRWALTPCVYRETKPDWSGHRAEDMARDDATISGILEAARARRATSERAAVLCENYRWFR